MTKLNDAIAAIGRALESSPHWAFLHGAEGAKVEFFTIADYRDHDRFARFVEAVPWCGIWFESDGCPEAFGEGELYPAVHAFTVSTSDTLSEEELGSLAFWQVLSIWEGKRSAGAAFASVFITEDDADLTAGGYRLKARFRRGDFIGKEAWNDPHSLR